MRKSLSAFILIAAGATGATAQTPAQPATLRLSVDEAVRLALDNNPDLKADRLDPQIGDTRMAAAAGAFRPTVTTGVQRNNQLLPPTSFLIPTPTQTDVVSSTAGVKQLLPWFGTSYNIGWTATHTDSNSFLNSYNPLVQSGLSVNVSQPLVRDLAMDAARQQLATTRINRDVADTRLRESIVRTQADVKTAYWNLVSARATVDTRHKALDLAQELARVNKARVDVGQAPPLDLVSAQAEVASNEEQLIVAETAVKQAEDRLRLLILDTADKDAWTVALDTVDSPPVGLPEPNVESAIAAALQDRTDLARARKDIETSDISTKFAGNQRLPDIRLNASYQASGLGGTQVLRTGGFPGTIVGAGAVTDFASVLTQLFGRDYPTWTVGVSVSYPIGDSAEEANFARTRLERTQAQERLKSAEAKVVQQVRDAGWKIQMNGRRIQTARAARELAEQRLDAEQKRLDVGLSTNFLVIQAQRDLAQAQTNELSAILAYDLALVDFDAVQLAPPSGSGSPGTTATAAPTTPVTAPASGGAGSGTGSSLLGGVAIPGITQ